MDKLLMYGMILDLCEQGQDYGELWFRLFHENLENSKKTLTLNNVINNSEQLGFKIVAQYLDDNIGELEIKNFITYYSIDVNRNFFDVVREITDKCGLFRFEAPQTFGHSELNKTTSIAYVPRG